MRDARRERRAERRRRQAERQAERRRAAGAQPRAVYEGRSAERIKPWTIEGVSRRTGIVADFQFSRSLFAVETGAPIRSKA